MESPSASSTTALPSVPVSLECCMRYGKYEVNGFKMIEMGWKFPTFTGLSHSKLFLFNRSCLPQNGPTRSSISGLDLSSAYIMEGCK